MGSSIIIAMPNPTNAKQVGDILRRNGLEPDYICSLGSEALRVMNERDNGVLICTNQLKDVNYFELLGYMPENFSMLLLTRNPEGVEPSERLEKLLNPFRTTDLVNTLNTMLSGIHRRLKKKKPAPRSEEEQQVIDKAKEILMIKNAMTEPDAFRYLQKSSMDSGRSLVESAHMIIMLNAED